MARGELQITPSVVATVPPTVITINKISTLESNNPLRAVLILMIRSVIVISLIIFARLSFCSSSDFILSMNHRIFLSRIVAFASAFSMVLPTSSPTSLPIAFPAAHPRSVPSGPAAVPTVAPAVSTATSVAISAVASAAICTDTFAVSFEISFEVSFAASEAVFFAVFLATRFILSFASFLLISCFLIFLRMNSRLAFSIASLVNE